MQSVFVLGRSIHNNILLTHEIMHKFRTKTGKTAWAIKLDMEKAYDGLEWDFIRKCFQELGFHSTWIKWIMEAISSVSYSIMVNDIRNGLVIPSRGIRQGKPLSLYIFIICMEVFTQSLLREATTHRSGIGVKIYPQSTIILCLFFADDCLLFCKAQ